MAPGWWRRWMNRQAPLPDNRTERPIRRRKFLPSLESLEDRTLLAAGDWVAIGPAPILNAVSPGSQPASGRIAAVAAHPSNANIIYIAAAGGGVWKTADAGTTWQPLTDSQSSLVMGALAVAPSNPNVIYAGTGEANNSGDSFYGRGFLKSTDAGAAWTLLDNGGAFDRRAFSKIVVHPTDPNTVYAATTSAVNGLSGNKGIWKSTDGGQTWTNTTASISTSLAWSDLVMHPTNSSVLYAAAGEPFGNALNGVYTTANAGQTWTLVTGGGTVPSGSTVGRVALAVAPSAPQTLYVSMASPSTFSVHRLLRATNGGTNWTNLTSGTPDFLKAVGWYANSLAVDPANSLRVFAGGGPGAGGIVESTDGGVTWTSIDTGAGGTTGTGNYHHAFGVDAGGRLLDSTDSGLWRLDNPTNVSWANLNGNLQVTLSTSIALNPVNANIAYATSQSTGTLKFTGSTQCTQARVGSAGRVRVEASNPTTVYHTYTGASIERSNDGGATWVSINFGINASDSPTNFYPPLVIDPANGARLLCGTNRVYETVNRGSNWFVLSTVGSGGWTISDAIDALAAAFTDANTIYAAAGGRVVVTANRGTSWTVGGPTLTSPSLTEFTDLLVDPTDARIAYVVAANFASVTGGGHIWRTTNRGATWTNISGSGATALPDVPARAIELDAGGAGSADDVLYVGTDNGVYYSTNLGATWARLRGGLPNVQVTDLELSTNLGILSAGTYGRGVWDVFGGSISGQKFDDTNGNGVKDAGEPGLAGWTIFLDSNSDGIYQAATEAATVTDPAGNYSFFGLAPGVYSVREVAQSGWVQTTVNLLVGVSGVRDVTGVNFGNFRRITLSGSIYHDSNGNGTRDAGEPGLSGRTVFLDSNLNNAFDAGETSAVTNASGDFAFTGLGPPPAFYYEVRQVPQAGWGRSSPNPPSQFVSSGVNIAGLAIGNVPLSSTFASPVSVLAVPVPFSVKVADFKGMGSRISLSAMRRTAS